MSCSFLTSQLCSRSCLSYGDVICGISCLCSLGYLFCGDVINGIDVVYLIAQTTGGITLTTIGIVNSSILPPIILCAFKFVLSYSLFTLEPKALPSSTLFFLLGALLRESITTFFLFSSVIYSSSSFNLGQWFLWIVLLMHK